MSAITVTLVPHRLPRSPRLLPGLPLIHSPVMVMRVLLILILIGLVGAAESTQNPRNHQKSSSLILYGDGDGYGESCSTKYINDIPSEGLDGKNNGSGGGGCNRSAFLKCTTFYGPDLISRFINQAVLGISGKCVCATTDMVYNETLSICVVLAGTSCTENPNCISNADCTNSTTNFTTTTTDTRMDIDPDARICKCQEPAYRFHTGGDCLLWHHQPCTEDFECHVGVHLKCMEATLTETDGYKDEEIQAVGVYRNSQQNLQYLQKDQKLSTKRCECKYDSHVWSDDADTCVGLHGTECSKKGDKCVKDAFCNLDQVCRCNDERYSPTLGKKCLLKYGSVCNHQNLLCNHYNNLRCSEGSNISNTSSNQSDKSQLQKCECLNSTMMQYHPEDDKCYVRLGKSCEVKAPKTTFNEADDRHTKKSSMDLSKNCVPNARCDFGGQSGQLICQCRDGHFENHFGRCEAFEDSGGMENYNDLNGSLSLVLSGLILRSYMMVSF